MARSLEGHPFPASHSPGLARYAFFFDLDGTLAPIADTPDTASVPSFTIDVLRRLVLATGGAVAVVSGRSVASLDHLLSPLHLPLSGLHGAQWRGPAGDWWQLPMPVEESARLRRALHAVAARHDGVFVEDKELSFAVHYRHAPQRETELRREVGAAAAPFAPRYVLQFGKMVAEVKPAGVDKGQALARFMEIEPFSARVPVMAGDDLTDEPAFETVNRHLGISLKIGLGDSVARHRLDSPGQLAQWLASLLADRYPPEHDSRSTA